jgi:hypothetical protein
MMKSDDLRAVIRPVLVDMGYWSQASENLLMGTAATESALGTYLFQVEGPALGIFQMEPATHDDIHGHFLAYRPELRAKVLNWSASGGAASELAWNLAYAAAMCRCHYLRDPVPLPQADDVAGMAATWKRHYNTHKGRGDEADYIAAYRTRVQRR